MSLFDAPRRPRACGRRHQPVLSRRRQRLEGALDAEFGAIRDGEREPPDITGIPDPPLSNILIANLAPRIEAQTSAALNAFGRSRRCQGSPAHWREIGGGRRLGGGSANCLRKWFWREHDRFAEHIGDDGCRVRHRRADNAGARSTEPQLFGEVPNAIALHPADAEEID
jgi:hypothetical protein